MERFIATRYRGYSQVKEHITLEQLFEQIAGDTYRRPVEAIEQAMEEGNEQRAERVKRQLPYFTLTAVYAERRLPYSLTVYQDARILDFDEMPREDIERLRRIAEADEATLACALSPRRHGLKLVVSLKSEEALRTRAALEAKGTATYAELERYHKRRFELEAAYYERLLGNRVDPSGSDLARGMYATYDPKAFYSPQRVKALRPLNVALTLPTKEESTPRPRRGEDPDGRKTGK